MDEAAKLAAKQAEEALRAKGVIASAIADAQAPLLKTMEVQSKAISDLTAQIGEMIKAGAGAVATGTQKATNNFGDPREGAGVTGGEHAAKGSGVSAIRVMKANLSLQLKGDRNPSAKSVQEQLKAWGYDHEERGLARTVERGMTQGIFADGGALVPTEYTAELIALLRNATAVRKLGATVIPMGAALEMPSQDSASTAAYVGEGVAITNSTPTVGGLRLQEKKLAALVVVSNDLIRNAALSAEEFIRNDLVNVMAIKEDHQALFGVGSVYSPRGLVSMILAANQYNQTAVSHTVPTLAEVKAILAKAVRILMESNLPLTRLGWIFNPRTWAYLWSITDGNGNSVFQAEMSQGKLCGHPFIVTNQVPNNLTWTVDGSTDVSCIFFGDWVQMMIGESMSPVIELFPNAAYDVSGTVHSGISKDQSVIRAMAKHDFGTRYNTSHVIIKTRMGG